MPTEVFGRQIAFNTIPAIGSFLPEGDTDEEAKMRLESRKMLHLPELPVSCTCVRVAVFNGHGASVNLELLGELTPERAREILKGAPGVLLVDDPAEREFPTSVDAAG